MATLAHDQSIDKERDIDEKIESRPVELEDVHAIAGAAGGQLVSHYAEMPRGQMIRKFWRLFLIGVGVASAGM